MTATERLFRGDSDEYMSMDDPRDYGNLIYELSFKEAINSKPPIISDYKIITFGITTPEIEKIADKLVYAYKKNKLIEYLILAVSIHHRQLNRPYKTHKLVLG